MGKRFETVLVTGASSGMGREFAERLLAEGMTVYVAARRADRMAALAEKGAIVLEMDITKDDQIVAAVQRIVDGHGGVDVLINNAGYGQYGAVEDTAIDTARYQFEVNLFGLARLTQLLLPSMRAKGRGRIINISSMGGKMYTPLGAWYHATKHALEGWSDALRLELAPHGIDVVIVEPGIIRTGFADAMNDHFAPGQSGAYDDLSGALQKSTAKNFENPKFGSPPSVISDLVLRAIRAGRPKTRYAGGQMARPLMFLRWLLPDRTYDRILMSQLK